MRSATMILVFFVIFNSAIFAAENSVTVVSPNGDLSMTVDCENELSYSVKYRKKELISPSKLGLKFKDIPSFGSFEIKNVRSEQISTKWQYHWGRQVDYLDEYNGSVITLEEKDAPHRSLGLECRAYNEGITFRYLISDKTVGRQQYVLEKDQTQFHFQGDPVAWFADLPSFQTPQEACSSRQRLTSIGEKSHVGCPLVVQSGEKGPWLALTEADLDHWGGLYFAAQPQTGMKVAFESGVMNSGDRAKPFKISLENVKQFTMICDDNKDASYDHADWVDLDLVDRRGRRTNLTLLTPVSVSQGYGTTNVDRSCSDLPLRIAGVEYPTGIGTHSTGAITFDVDPKYVSLEGAAGVDDAVAPNGSIRFFIRTIPRQKQVSLEARLSPRLDGRGVAIHSVPDQSPWRIVIVAPKAIDLVNQSILMNVSRPCDPDVDWSWVKPGTASWDWWSGSNVVMNTDTIKHFIGFASEMGWEYTFVDAPWYGESVLKGKPDVFMNEVVRFAREKNVRLFLWLYWKDVDHCMEEAFALYQKWGIAGVKIDFMERDDQEMVQWYDKAVKLAAKYQLMVNFHGSFKPTGKRREWPNLINRESVFGNEQNIWGRITPEQYCVIPYTRLILGPADFTPGAFLNRHYDGEGSHIEDAKSAQGIGTRAHELAISFLYDSPVLCLCDRPENYRDQRGLEFYRDLPTTWDESHGVAGEIGEYFSMIRRKGETWYYGVITNDEPRTLRLPLKFLEKGTRYEAVIYADTPETDYDAREISITRKNVSSSGTLQVDMVRNGGQVIVFRKKGK